MEKLSIEYKHSLLTDDPEKAHKAGLGGPGGYVKREVLPNGCYFYNWTKKWVKEGWAMMPSFDDIKRFAREEEILLDEESFFAIVRELNK